jgi:L-gulono-1,4-lactone dehydrogenase
MAAISAPRRRYHAGMTLDPDAGPHGEHVERHAWRNWSGLQRCAPSRIERPSTESELSDIVREAASSGERVKVAGSGHSFTGIALTDGRMIDMSRYGDVLSIDSQALTATVQVGTRLSKLNETLEANGLALPNLGDIQYQTLAGAISTGTHGTGIRYHGIASQVAAMRLVAGDGSIVECSPDQEPDVFRAARVGLGALGVLSTVTLRCVPSFTLRAVEEPMRLEELLERLDELVNENDHFEFYYVPHTSWCLTKRNNRIEGEAAARPRWREFFDDVLIQNIAFEAICRVGRIAPGAIPRLAKVVAGSGRTDYSDASHRVFTSPRTVRFNEMEYSIPREAAGEAITRVRELVDRSGLRVSFPIEVRFLAGDDIPLSMAHGRESCFIAVHMYVGTPFQQYFEGVESIMNDYEGRPHWGKLHFQTAETLAPRYGEWDAFQEVRSRVDPEGMFANEYLERVLGPTRRGGLPA